MPQECPVHTNRKAPLAFGHIGKPLADILHHCLPMRAALWMKLKFYRNDNYVLNGIIQAAKCIGKTFIPFFVIG